MYYHFRATMNGQPPSALFHAQNTQARPAKLSHFWTEPTNVQSMNTSSPDSSARMPPHMNTGPENAASSFMYM